MKTRLIDMGRSKGIRLPKKLIKEAQLTEEVEVSLQGDSLVIRSKKKNPREGWAESLANLAQHENISFLGDNHGNSWDEEEWEW